MPKSARSLVHQRVVCTSCAGRGRSHFGFFRCRRCLGSGELIRMIVPEGRSLCSLCRGWRTIVEGMITMQTRRVCPLCKGIGLEPKSELPESVRCPHCAGIGSMSTLDKGAVFVDHVSDGRIPCASCGGTGINTDLPDHILGEFFTKEVCRGCQGYGYKHYLRSWPCDCSGRGWIPGKKFDTCSTS